MNTVAYFTLIISLIGIVGTCMVASKDNLKSKSFIAIVFIAIFMAVVISYTYFFNNKEKPIKWEDKAFEKMIQKALNKEGEEIYPKQVENITTLYVIGDKVAYIDKTKEEVNYNIYTDKSAETSYVQFKLVEENATKRYDKKGDIMSLNDIKNFKELKELHIILNKIEDMSPLSACPKLEILELSLNEIQNIQIPNTFENLKSLFLGANKIEDISPLQSKVLINLERLALFNNEIKDIALLENLVNKDKITFLNFSYNKICDIPKFDEYKSLNSLYLNSNFIRNLDSLSSLEWLQNLSLDYNKIKDISVLQKLSDLKILNLNYNSISTIDSIKNLNLSILNLYENRLKSFPEDFGNKLCSIDVRENFISDKNCLKKFKNLSSDFPIFDVVAIPDNEDNITKLTIKINNLYELDSVSYVWDLYYSNWNTTNKEQFELDIPSEEGTHTLYIKATDKFGNTAKDKDEKEEIQFSYIVKSE